MLSIFRTLVELFGYPGDTYEAWVEFVHKHKDVLTSAEFDKAQGWLVLWSQSLQTALHAMKGAENG